MRIISATLIFVTITILFSQDTKEFYLKSGDRVSGIVTGDTDSTYTLETAFGSVTIKKKDVRQQEVFIFLKSGDKLRGIILSESEEGVNVKAQFGEVFVSRDKI